MGAGEHVDRETSMQSSNHSSRSDLSFSVPSSKPHQKSKLPRRPSKSERPRSPSQMSNASTMSAASHLSNFSHSSQVSHGLHNNKSLGSMNSVASVTASPSVLATKESSLKRPIKSASATLEQRRRSENLSGSLSSNEQARLRNVKNQQPLLNKSSHHPPDLLNSSSVATTPRRNPAKEIVRLEALCENHVKEKHHMKSYIEQQNRGFEAMTMVVDYMTTELQAFSHPHMIWKVGHLENQLETTLKVLEQMKLEKCELENKISSAIEAHSAEINKIGESHSLEVTAMKDTMIENHEEEILKLKEKFSFESNSAKAAYEEELNNLKTQHEALVIDNKKIYDAKILDLGEDYKSQLEKSQIKLEADLAAADEKFTLEKAELENKIANLITKCKELQQEKRDFEEKIMKDSDLKVQIVVAKNALLEKEVDSLKTVDELKTKEIHNLRKERNRLKKQEEELHFAQEKIKLLSARAEDLQAQVDIKNHNERQLSSEREAFKDWYEKESKVTKRLSMEKEELQWRLSQNVEGSTLFTIFGNDSTEQQYSQDSENWQSSASLSPVTTPKLQNRRSCPLMSREKRGRPHRYSVSENDFRGESSVSPGTRYRRSGSLSWTATESGTEELYHEKFVTQVSSEEPTVVFNLNESTDSCDGAEMHSQDDDESSVFSSSDLQTSDIFLNENSNDENEFKFLSLKTEVGLNGNVETKREEISVDSVIDKETCLKNDAVNQSAPKSQAQEDCRVPSLITIRHLENCTPAASSKLHAKPFVSKENKLRFSIRKQSKGLSSPLEVNGKTKGKGMVKSECMLNTTFIKSDEEVVQEKIKQDECTPVINPAHSDRHDEVSFPVADIVNVNENVTNKSDDLPSNVVKKEIFEQQKEFEQELEFGFEPGLEHTGISDGCESKSNAQGSMVDAIELDYTARCFPDMEESQNSSMTDSIGIEGTEESRNSSDFEISSEPADQADTQSLPHDWGISHISFSEGDDSPVNDKIQDSKISLLNKTLTLSHEFKSTRSSSPTSHSREHMEMLQTSDSSTSASATSSPQVSPVFRTRNNCEAADSAPCGFAMSPRTSAGEAMVTDLPNTHHHEQLRDSAAAPLRRMFHDHFGNDNASSCNSSTRISVDSGGRDSSSEEASQVYISKPATPESSSQAVGPTDSTNIDLSWSDEEEDGIPFESEV